MKLKSVLSNLGAVMLLTLAPAASAPAQTTGSSRATTVSVFMDGKELMFHVDPARGEMSYKEALAYCDNLRAEGHSDWRLPTSRELGYYFDENPADNQYYWIDYDGVLLDGKTIPYFQQTTNMRYDPCINGKQLIVHRYNVNAREEYVAGEKKTHLFVPVRTVSVTSP